MKVNFSESSNQSTSPFGPVEAYPIPHVTERFCNEQGLSAEAGEEYEVELKKYLWLCSLNDGKNLGMAGPVDELWHTFIIHTRDYEVFCREVLGKFIHHTPTSLSAKANGTAKMHYDEFLATYQRTFGVEAPLHIWPRITNKVQLVDNSCGGCSSCSGGHQTIESNCDGCSGCGNAN